MNFISKELMKDLDVLTLDNGDRFDLSLPIEQVGPNVYSASYRYCKSKMTEEEEE